MRSLAFALAVLLSAPAFAQANGLFGSGKPPVFREEDPDRKFSKSRLKRMLDSGTEDPNCTQLIGGLLMVLGESAPLIHKRDENLYIDPILWQATAAHLSNTRYPAQQSLIFMLRRVLIDGKLPKEWLATAAQVNQSVKFIDMGKLQFLADGVKPIDSWAFTLPELQQRYALEVLRANSTAAPTAVQTFRDSYIDRDVAWNRLVLIDVGREAPPPKKGKKKKTDPPDLPPDLVANFRYAPPDPNRGQLQLFAKQNIEPAITVSARLLPEQYLDYAKVPAGTPLMVRGRLWDMNKTATHFEIREALLFQDRDYSAGVVLADPEAVARCPAAVNEFQGAVPNQPGGFKHR